jgi:hypothetical protein
VSLLYRRNHRSNLPGDIGAPVVVNRQRGKVGVLEAPDNHMPIGIANRRTWDENGLVVWELTVREEKIPGRWVIVDRELRAAEQR